MASPPQNGDWSEQGRCFSSSLGLCDVDQSAANAIGTSATNPIVSVHQLPPSSSHNGMKETEELLAAELNKLSVEERSKAFHDVHCVGEVLEETPEKVERSLNEFQQIVQAISNPIYELALKQNRFYVEDTSFRLKFIRANIHNVTKSVQQMMNFLQQKAVYFGEDNVAQDIRAHDMSTEETELMRSGLFQILNARDPSGRVIVYRHSIPIECRVETFIRVMYHIFFNYMDSDSSVQTKGLVCIYYDEKTKEDVIAERPGLNFRMTAIKFFLTLPIRVSSMHLCINSAPKSLTLHNHLAQMTIKALQANVRARIRIHYGSDIERQYILQTFGVRLETFPVDTEGNVRLETRKWCDKYLGIATSAADPQPSHGDNDAPITVTNGLWETDVLFGRGRLVQYHPGNIRYRDFLDQHREEYDGYQRNQRRKACIDYTQELLANGTRFLKQNETEMWVVCDFEEVVDKIAQFYRTRRRRIKQEAEKK